MQDLKNLHLYLTFDDVLILPQFSDVGSKDGNIKTRVSKNVEIEIPIVSSPMDTVTEEAMAVAIAEEGGIGVIHRNMTAQNEAKQVKNVKAKNLQVIGSVGPFDLERSKMLEEAGADAILIEVAHGSKKDILESANKIKKEIKCDLICGSIATKEGAEIYAEIADGYRVGIGPGSICTMRIITGVGVPQLNAVSEVMSVAKKYGIPVIADGGIRSSGDIAKAIAVGADTVMLGNLLAGFDESPGELVEIDGKKYKSYRGMGSRDAMEKGPVSDRYEQEKIKKKISMGVSGMVAYKGSVKNQLYQLVGGLKASMGLVGAWNIKEMQEKAKLIRITNAGTSEGHPHTLVAFKLEDNYAGR